MFNSCFQICTKCVKCKSCGATTPGAAYNATWTHDFSLCYECGMLMDKGNYCPICHSTYADDDWDCKMIQCSTCNSWVHAKCEGLTGMSNSLDNIERKYVKNIKLELIFFFTFCKEIFGPLFVFGGVMSHISAFVK